MLVFVDIEHASASRAEHGPRIQAARTWITYRLEDLSGRHCHLVRYDRVDEALLEQVDADAIFLSGNSVDPERYDRADLDPFLSLLDDTELPVFGFCGGFQFLMLAHGCDVVPLGESAAVDGERVIEVGGRPFEFGYHPIDIRTDATGHPLFVGLDPAPVFRHAHGLHVPNPPAGFETLASTPATEVQVVVDAQRRRVGTQFHPEYWTDEHDAGRTLIANFLDWVGLAPVNRGPG